MTPQIHHSKYENEQQRAYDKLEEEESLTYEELKESLDLEQSKMQAVIRGLLDNGLVESSIDDEGHRHYTPTKD